MKGFLSRFRRLNIGNNKQDTGTEPSVNSDDNVLPPDVPQRGPDRALDAYREMDRLWPMFSVIFKDHPGYNDLVSPVMISDLSSHFEKMVGGTQFCTCKR